MGKVVWFTGLSGSGKTTLAEELKNRLEKFGKRVRVIDGDEVRKSHTRHLGFSREDLRENNRVMAELAREATKSHDYVLVPKISPLGEDRQIARQIIGVDFKELFVEAPLEVCMARDPKGLYKKVGRGEIADMIGVSASNPYEAPLSPDMHVRTDIHSVKECADMILKKLRRPRRLILLHIGRSGGSTLRNIIERQFALGQVLRIMSKGKDATFEKIEARTPEEREKLKFISGHLPFGAHTLFSTPSEYITLIRDPVGRVISEYYSVRRKPKHEFYEAAQKMTLKEYALSGVGASHNNQTRILSGFYRPGQTFSTASAFGKDALEAAKKNLREHFSLAGVTERFDEMLLVAAKEFGWKNFYYTKRQVNKSRPSDEAVDQETRAVIEERNKFDRELHSHAAAMLDEKIRNYGPDFERDLARFRKMNKIYQPILRARELASEFLPMPVKQVIKFFIT